MKLSHLRGEHVSMVFHIQHEQKQPLEVFCEKKVFLKLSQISQENTCVGVSL